MMDAYSVLGYQEEVRNRLRSRDSGFANLNLAGSETITTLFSRQVQQRAQKLAIVSDGDSLTYQQLDELSATIGCMVARESQSERKPVALLVSQHTYLCAAILGVLRIGRFYTPLDPSYPLERNALILRLSNARTILTERANQQLAQQLALPGQQVLYVDEVGTEYGSVSDESHPDLLAYVIFTSGSTGTPKGVIQTQRNVVEAVRRYTSCLYLGHRDSVSLLSSCSVTASVPPLLGSLLNGATLRAFSVIKKGLNALADWLAAEEITVYDSAPSLFRHLMRSLPENRRFPDLQVVRLASDTAYKSDWDLFVQHCPEESVLVNVYGCSEIPTVCRFYADRASHLVDNVLPVGYPLDGVEIAVVGPDGVAMRLADSATHGNSSVPLGEIVLQSLYLSPGYWTDSLVSDVADNCVLQGGSVRSYKTGDLGAIRGDCGLIHLGRGDLQTKVSGFRVEISEVEACLRDCPGVVEAAVLVHIPDHGERDLVGFVVSNSVDVQDGPSLRSYLQHKLPPHMVPSTILFVDEIPCTPNGKVDRSALLALKEGTSKESARLCARTPVEKAVSQMWKEVLSFEQIGIKDNFFELNGNSLLAMRILSRIEEVYGIQFDVSTILQHPTIMQLARVIESFLAEAPASIAQQATTQL